MKIEIRETKTDGIVQITTLDERWYHNQLKGIFRPSSTWIAGHYPKGIEFYKWLAQKGWDESEALKKAGGNRGSKVHQGIEHLMKEGQIAMDARFLNSRGDEEELTVEEWECIISFYDWFLEAKPEILAFEQIVESDKYNYAGTLDLKCKIDDEIWIVDFKTSAHIWPEMGLQLSSYKHADGNEDVVKQGILQLNYKKNKARYKFTELEDKFGLFLAAREIWMDENKDKKPAQKDYPILLQLPRKVTMDYENK